jgi:hypothetical protein
VEAACAQAKEKQEGRCRKDQGHQEDFPSLPRLNLCPSQSWHLLGCYGLLLAFHFFTARLSANWANCQLQKRKGLYIVFYPGYIANHHLRSEVSMEKKTSKSNNEKRNGRMIHVRLPEEVHKRLRIKVAEDDTTIQDWVAAVVAIELERQGKRK